jgi:SAM-dependent methyltransferase
MELEQSINGAESQIAWSEHWSADRQESFSQRFFSFYRKAVFARTVRYFANRYFPKRGIFVEAGSGTAETSMFIDKHLGARRLVATDIVQSVLKQCHPIMDSRVCADIFRLPYADDSVDGVWNVGVMEHFTHPEIDRILGEIHRVLKPGHRVILLWPGTNSLPQKMLRVVEFFINARSAEGKFSFHPPEISQLSSRKQAIEVLNRNGFTALKIDGGLRSLFAFKTLVASKADSSRG